jgi:two-component system, NarL family, capsular synthesis sensor histidine kinase RcsC
VVVGLLIFAAICGSSAACYSILTSTFKRELLAAQTVTRDINQAIFSRYDIITTGSLVLELRAKEALPAHVRPRSNGDECTLRDACLAARQLISSGSTPSKARFSTTCSCMRGPSVCVSRCARTFISSRKIR